MGKLVKKVLDAQAKHFFGHAVRFGAHKIVFSCAQETIYIS